jgi:hypothetical protein
MSSALSRRQGDIPRILGRFEETIKAVQGLSSAKPRLERKMAGK